MSWVTTSIRKPSKDCKASSPLPRWQSVPTSSWWYWSTIRRRRPGRQDGKQHAPMVGGARQSRRHRVRTQIWCGPRVAPGEPEDLERRQLGAARVGDDRRAAEMVGPEGPRRDARDRGAARDRSAAHAAAQAPHGAAAPRGGAEALQEVMGVEKPFGWRRRIGLISPTVIEMISYDFYRMAPSGVGMCGITSNIEFWDKDNF